MFNIETMSAKDVYAASILVTRLRTAMNGREVCSPSDMASILNMSLMRHDYTGLIARDSVSGDIAGYLGLNRRFAIYAGGTFAQVTELFVESAHRRYGCARELMRVAEVRALEFSSHAIEVGAPEGKKHPGTLSFYESIGFKVIGPRLSKTL